MFIKSPAGLKIFYYHFCCGSINNREMKILFVAFFIAATSATSNFDLSEVETKKLLVPENPQEFLTSKLSSGFEKSRDERIANGTDAVDGQFPYAVRQF